MRLNWPIVERRTTLDEFDAMRRTVQKCAEKVEKKVPADLLSSVLQAEIDLQESREAAAQEVVRLINQAVAAGEA